MGKKDKKKEPEINIEDILTKLSRFKNLSNKEIERHINRSTKVEKSSLKNQWGGYLNNFPKKLDELKNPDSMVPIYKDLKNLTVILSTLYNKHDKFYSAQLNNAKNKLIEKIEGYIGNKLLKEIAELKDPESMVLICDDLKKLEEILLALDKHYKGQELDNAENEARKKMYEILCNELEKIKKGKIGEEEKREEEKSEYINGCSKKVNKLIKEINNIHGVDDTKSVEKIDMIIDEYDGIKGIEKKDYRNNEGKVKESEFIKLKKLLQKAENIAEDIKKYDKGIYRELINKINESIKTPNFYSQIYEIDFKKGKSKIYKSLKNEISIMGHNAILKIGSYDPENNQININEDDIEKALNKINPSLSSLKLSYLTKRIYNKMKLDKDFIKENLSS